MPETPTRGSMRSIVRLWPITSFVPFCVRRLPVEADTKDILGGPAFGGVALYLAAKRPFDRARERSRLLEHSCLLHMICRRRVSVRLMESGRTSNREGGRRDSSMPVPLSMRIAHSAGTAGNRDVTYQKPPRMPPIKPLTRGTPP
jgi:hypothetical protein